MKNIVVITKNLEFTRSKIMGWLTALGLDYTLYKSRNVIKIKGYNIKFVSVHNGTHNIRGLTPDVVALDELVDLDRQCIDEIYAMCAANDAKIVDI